MTAAAFNRTSELVACSDHSNEHNLYVINWRTSAFLLSIKTGTNKIFHIDWSTTHDENFVTVGGIKVQFWDLATKDKQG